MTTSSTSPGHRAAAMVLSGYLCRHKLLSRTPHLPNALFSLAQHCCVAMHATSLSAALSLAGLPGLPALMKRRKTDGGGYSLHLTLLHAVLFLHLTVAYVAVEVRLAKRESLPGIAAPMGFLVGVAAQGGNKGAGSEQGTGKPFAFLWSTVPLHLSPASCGSGPPSRTSAMHPLKEGSHRSVG